LGASHEIQADEPFPTGVELSFKTGGSGVFVPANLGDFTGNQKQDEFVIGDGSGLATYDGTPTGKEFHLNGKLVGDGFDRHFGAAQSTGAPRLGKGDEKGLVFYDIVNAPNPIDPTRSIHIMKNRRGEVWFVYGDGSFFKLDGAAGTLTHDTEFTVVGGTKLFAGATGSVNVVCVTSLADVFPDDDGNLNAPFRYDFNGTIVLAENDDD